MAAPPHQPADSPHTAPTQADFEALADNLPEAAWIADADGWITWYNRRWYDYTGTTAADMTGWGWQSVHDPEILPTVLKRWQTSIATGAPFEMVFPLRGADGVLRPFLTRIRPVHDGGGALTCWIGSNTDITSQKEAEAARQLLTRELNHRVKNLFAIAAGLVGMAARRASTVEDMADDLKSRLMSLARAHELIHMAVADEIEEIGSATLMSVLMTVVAPHTPLNPEQLSVDGPPVWVGQNATTSLALVLHELATNAVKYGAFSVPDGCLAISWRRDDDMLKLLWAEKNGPAILAPPTQQGFGSQLTRRSVEGQLGGTIHYDWQVTGVQIALTASLKQLLA